MTIEPRRKKTDERSWLRRVGKLLKPGRDMLSGFSRDEDAGILVLFSMMLIVMLMVIGFSMELALGEHLRSKVQNTTDSASLAAADLEQTLDPTDVVTDFFLKAGLEDSLEDVTVSEDSNGRTVSVEAEIEFDALLTRAAGIDTWEIPVEAGATESRGDIEIAVALDNSNSMSWAPGSTSGPSSTPSRMDLLIPAAEAFVDAVQPPPGGKGTTTISLVPFGTQVSAGADLLGLLNATSEHSRSHCVTYLTEADYRTTTLSPTTPLTRTAHHDPVSSWTYGWDLNPDLIVCPPDTDRDILPWSEDTDDLKAKIRSMEPYGYTSIEIATKWAVALLDPSMRPVLASLASREGYEYLSASASRGAPANYDPENSLKYLIVMSDGENTRNWDIKDPYRSGDSPVYKLSGSNEYSYYRNRSGTRRDYYRVSIDRWRTSPGRNARRLTWDEVWAEMNVQKFVVDILSEADSSKSVNAYYNDIVESSSSSWKNNRTEDICDAAKDRGIVVFTIGMDTYGQGDATLSDCASSPSHFYDVQGLDIASAFASIARQINQLRLTQ